DVHHLGIVVAQALTALDGDAAELRGALPPPLIPVIDRATAADPGSRYPTVAAFATDLQARLDGGAAAPTAIAARELCGSNPYKGLRAFDATDAADFYGRERLVERLISRIGQPGSRSRFVAVVGPSGSGKSSVVRAGLLPAIRAGAVPASDAWFTIEMTPA